MSKPLMFVLGLFFATTCVAGGMLLAVYTDDSTPRFNAPKEQPVKPKPVRLERTWRA